MKLPPSVCVFGVGGVVGGRCGEGGVRGVCRRGVCVWGGVVSKKCS